MKKNLNQVKEVITKQVLKRKYNIQRIDGLEESKVTPPESVYKRIKEENNKIGEARAINSDLPFFKNQFIMPVKGIISGVYGSQRILNGKPKWPHYGIDIAAKKGTKIKSSSTEWRGTGDAVGHCDPSVRDFEVEREGHGYLRQTHETEEGRDCEGIGEGYVYERGGGEIVWNCG